jgi:hypothetical protein
MFELELRELAETVRKEVEAYRHTPSIAVVRRTYVRRRDLTLRYAHDFGFANFPPQHVEKEIWDLENKARFEDSVLKALPTYQALFSRLDEGKTAIANNFVTSICAACFLGLSDADLDKRVMSCGCELGGATLPVKITAFLDGLSIDSRSVAVSQYIVLRQPEFEDMAQYVPLDEFGGFSFPLADTFFRVVGEFSMTAPNSGQAQMMFLRNVAALQLFAVGGITAGRYTMTSDHAFLAGANATLGQVTRRSRFACLITTADAARLDSFLRDISQLLPDPLEQSIGSSPREIALSRYRDSLFQSNPLEQCVTLAISSLEALFLKEEPELKHRLSQRVSVFLRVLGSHPDAMDTYNNVTQGYKIRSKFIHGGRAKDQPKVEALAPVVLDYARLSTLAFFQLKTTKDELLAQLDRVMIDPAAVDALSATLSAVRYR